mgnify:FL=1
MEIFSHEFKNWIKRNTICRLLGHKESDWMDEWWAPAHSTGYLVKTCDRCHLELSRKKAHLD